MASTNKTNPPAFGDILAGLGGAGRADAGRSPPRPGPAAGAPVNSGAINSSPMNAGPINSGMDVSWIQSARMRASAAQAAQRLATAPPASGTARPRVDPDQYAQNAARAADEAAEAAEAAPQPAGAEPLARTAAHPLPNPVHALWRVLGQLPRGWRAGAGAAASALGAIRPRRAAPAKETARPAQQMAGPAKSEDETIAEELGLRADLAIGDLRRIRRDFAKKNHPDRFDAAHRLGAARRMTIANMLIDAHMKQRAPLR